MRLIDEKFKEYKSRYFLQSLIIVFLLLVILQILDVIQQTAIIVSLGASSFILFAMPHVKRARPRYVVGGYLLGVLFGCLCHFMAKNPMVIEAFGSTRTALIFASAVAVGLTVFMMIVTNTEHPPAASIALGFVMNEWDCMTIACVILGIALMSAVHQLIKPFLRDLL